MCVFEQYNDSKISLSRAKETITRLAMMGADVGDERYDSAVTTVKALAYKKAKLARAASTARKKLKDAGYEC